MTWSTQYKKEIKHNRACSTHSSEIKSSSSSSSSSSRSSTVVGVGVVGVGVVASVTKPVDA
jgi:hypothetical protein